MRCYDAIGLMRHLSEDTAATYANALDVLTNDDPEMPSKTFCSSDKNLSDPDNCFLHNNQENMPPGFLVRNISKECSVRVCVCGLLYLPSALLFVAFRPCCVQVFSIGISTNVCWTNSGQNKMDIPHNYYRMLFEPYL